MITKLKIARDILDDVSSIGVLTIDGIYECYTLEDRDRKLEVVGCSAKVKKETCIPRGTYEVVIDYSVRFKRNMPHILDVPCFDGIRIHAGNTASDTEGCILLGKTEGKDWIGESGAQFKAFYPKLEAALKKGKVYLEIV